MSCGNRTSGAPRMVPEALRGAGLGKFPSSGLAVRRLGRGLLVIGGGMGSGDPGRMGYLRGRRKTTRGWCLAARRTKCFFLER